MSGNEDKMTQDMWAHVVRRALWDNESLCLDSEADRARLADVLIPLMESAERHGYVRGAMDVSEAAEALADANWAVGYVDGLEKVT